jgi:hypothetical protein
VTEDDFFEENLVRNLAALLGIPSNKIRVMNIVSAGGKRRRRSNGVGFINMQIGDPPAEKIEEETPSATSSPQAGITASPTQAPSKTSFEELQKISNSFVQAAQTGALSSSLGISVDVVKVKEPEPEPVDPTGGKRATNDSVASAPTNGTTFAEKQAAKEAEEAAKESTEGTEFLIPKKLTLINSPSMETNETVPFPIPAQLRMFDALDRHWTDG